MADMSKKYKQSVVKGSPSLFVGSTKTTEFMKLPTELLTFIFMLLAMSAEGGRALVRASTSCKSLLTIARQPIILRVVNYDMQMLLGYYKSHYRIDGLLCRCVRAGNDAADNILAMVILLGGTQLWTKIQEKRLCLDTIRRTSGLSLSVQRSMARSLVTGSIVDLPFIQFCLEDAQDIFESYHRLRPLRLMILFITRASPNQMFIFCFSLREFVLTILGTHMASESGILPILDIMCCFRKFFSEEKQVIMHPKFRNLLTVAFLRFMKQCTGTNVSSSSDLRSATIKLLLHCRAVCGL